MDERRTGSGITPLKGRNYPTWRLQCKMALLKENLWSCVEGDAAASDSASARTAEESIRMDKALAIIVLSIDPSLLYLIGEPINPRVVWKKLSDQFQQKTWSNRLSLRRKLINLRLKDDGSVTSHIKEMTELFQELAMIGSAVDEEDQVVSLLASLPDSFDMLVTALESQSEVPKFELVIERLIHEESKLRTKISVAEEESLALTTRAEGNKPYKGTSWSVKCFHCAGSHYIKNCPVLKKINKSEEAHPTVIASSAADGSIPSNQWILDSGASRHMCNESELFVSFRSLNSPQPVKLGDGREITGTGSGSVYLKLKLGVTVHLKDVLLVPRLNTNFFSIKQCTGMGHEAIFSKGGDAVLLKDENGRVWGTGSVKGPLYVLDVDDNDAKSASLQTAVVTTAVESEKIIISRNVTFDEKSFNTPTTSINPSSTVSLSFDHHIPTATRADNPNPDEMASNEDVCNDDIEEDNFDPNEGDRYDVIEEEEDIHPVQGDQQMPQGHRTRSGRTVRPPDYYGEWTVKATVVDGQFVPATVKEAMESDESARWKEAMNSELTSLKEFNVWKLVDESDVPPGKNLVTCKWIFLLVVSSWLIVFMAQATAFLHGSLSEDIYMTVPEGCEAEGMACKLLRSLYGLKQAPRCWNEELTGFAQCSDPCLFIREDGVILAVYVDDCLILHKDAEKVRQVVKLLSEKFSIRDLGNLSSFLGLDCQRDEGLLTVNQKELSVNILQIARMADCKPVQLPLTSNLNKDGIALSAELHGTYRTVVGKLLYLAMMSRPDLSFSVCQLSKFVSCPTQEHWAALKKVCRYLQGTREQGLVFKSSRDLPLQGFCDADFGSSDTGRRSITGFVFQCYGNLVSWKSKTQQTVALSTCEAEYMALCAAAQEAEYLIRILRELIVSLGVVTIWTTLFVT